MIFTDRTIMVKNGISSINDTIVLYRGDREVEIRFSLNEGSPFKFGSGSSPNIIEKTEATYGQLVIKTPGNLPPIFSEVAPTIGGKIIFTITAEMIDEITEIGNYTFQIRLLDDSMESRATLPEVKNGIEIREPIAIEDISTTNEVGTAAVGYALTTAGAQEDTFDAEGNYNKTTWGTGDRITAAKLNKIEAGIDGVNKKVANSGGMTTEQTQQLSTAYQHSQSTHAPSNAEANVQADWDETNTTSDAYIKNKPTNLVTTDDIPTVPTKTSELENDSNFITMANLPSASENVTAEVMDARIGADEVTYSTIGSAIRTQFGNLYKILGVTQSQEELTSEWEVGTLHSGANQNSTKVLRTTNYLKFDKELNAIPNSGYKVGYNKFTYDSSTNTYTYVGTLSRTPSGFTISGDNLQYYYRFTLANAAGTTMNVGDAVNCKFTTQSYTTSFLTDKKSSIINVRYEKVAIPQIINQDCCVVGDEIWMWRDNNGYVAINGDNFTKIREVSGSLSHGNAVDYIDNIMMICDTTNPYIYIYHNIKEKSTISESDSDCVKISLQKTDTSGNTVTFAPVMGSACFGESKYIMYYLDHDTNNRERNMVLYKILLGYGDNDLSDTSAAKNSLTNFGEFKAGCDENTFNGTFKVLKSFTGNLLGRDNRPQGMTYDGKLYVASGFDNLRCNVIEIDETNNKYYISHRLNFNITDYKNNSIKTEPEAVFIHKNELYLGGHHLNYFCKTKIY